jgi:pimeloyl-ACP methyl ester carboxylesterase
MPPEARSVRTPLLEIAYEVDGAPNGAPVILLHGFPDDVRAYDGVVPPLVAAGCRVYVPYLRGYGPTRFLDRSTPRMAQQAAIGQDLLEFMSALGITHAMLAGYDWGGRAACIVSLLAPSLVRGLVTMGGYNVQNTIAPSAPASATEERAYWYQWYFNTERGRAGLAQNRREICRLLWQDWTSPSWKFDEASFARTVLSFDNPDFVDIVIHSYRHRHRNAPSDLKLDAIEQQLATRPSITVPSVILVGADDGVGPPARSERDLARFPRGTDRQVVPNCGHFMPREQPGVIAGTILGLLTRTE